MRNDQDLCFLAINNSTLDIDPKTIACLNIRWILFYCRHFDNSFDTQHAGRWNVTHMLVHCDKEGGDGDFSKFWNEFNVFILVILSGNVTVLCIPGSAYIKRVIFQHGTK